MAHNSQKTADLNFEKRAVGAAAASTDRADQSSWLSDLLARASRDDEPPPAPVNLAHHGSMTSQSTLSEEQIPLGAAQQDHTQRRIDALNNLAAIHSKLSSALDIERKDSFQSSWPDFNAALNLVKDTAEALNRMKNRASAIEACYLKVVEQLRQELAEADARASSFDERIRATEQVAREIRGQLSASQQRTLRIEERARSAEQETKNAKAKMLHACNLITDLLSRAVIDFRERDPQGDVIVELKSKFDDHKNAESVRLFARLLQARAAS